MSLLKQWLWPDVSLRRQAQGAIQEAFWITLALAAYKFVLVLILFLRDSDADLNFVGLLEGITFAALGLGLYYRSRIAAVLSFSFYVLGFLYFFITVRPYIPVLPVLVALGLFAGVRGTFAYHWLPYRPKDLPTVEQSFQSVDPFRTAQIRVSNAPDLG